MQGRLACPPCRRAAPAERWKRRLFRALAAEAIGVLALVFVGCGVIMADAEAGSLGSVGVALAYAFVRGDAPLRDSSPVRDA